MSFIKSPAAGAQAGALDRMDHTDGITTAELYERHLEAVFRYVLQRVRSVDEAEDITGEVFAAAFAGLSGFRGQCPPPLWLMSIARRKIIDAHRRRAVRRETLASELPEEGPGAAALREAVAANEGPEAAVMRLEARRVLWELIDQLNPDQREALLLLQMERLSAAEAAVVMGRSVGSVYKLLHRARGTLRRLGRGYFLNEAEEQDR